MAEITIYYNKDTIDNIVINVKNSLFYSSEEKNYLFKMLNQMKQENFLLYMVEAYSESLFDFKIPDFQKHKKYLIVEVYRELLEQLVIANIGYEDITYPEIRKWFHGMNLNIDIINAIDKRFKEANIKISY